MDKEKKVLKMCVEFVQKYEENFVSIVAQSLMLFFPF